MNRQNLVVSPAMTATSSTTRTDQRKAKPKPRARRGRQSRVVKREQIIEEARSITPEWGQEYVAEAFEGDPDAVFRLMCALHDYQRASMAHHLYMARVRPEAFRVALEFAWTQSHHYQDVLREAGTWRQFVRWCRYASFELPAGVPDPVTIYRGVPNVTAARAAQGVAWTLDRERAEFFSRDYGGNANRPDTTPMVVSAMVPRGMLMFYSDERKEQEVIPETLPPSGWYRLRASGPTQKG